MNKTGLKAVAAALAASVALMPVVAEAQKVTGAQKARGPHVTVRVLGRGGGMTGGGGTTAPVATWQPWMHPDIADAWSQGFYGQGTTMTVIDDFTSASVYTGDLGTGSVQQRHGEWTSAITTMVAPSAKLAKQDFSSTRAVSLARRGLNVLNLSYGMFGDAGYTASQVGWSPREASIISYASTGAAVVSKAAGNDAVAVGAVNGAGKVDYLDSALVGKQSAVFVGALDRNGSIDAPASLAWYSNYAGDDPAVQNQFLTVGVEGSKTGLYGTSFAAPVVTGYAAILGSKFTRATPAQITNQLLDTARQDTVTNYDPARFGRGEASLSRALAPAAIK
ncbi:S8 family serine peptidase [Paracoccus sp. (in: a-proteobacteria)]|uniref:S8 family serine peptidase n=1 Tax=Paracoccus sp. TaxID=267 RepID=UPI003A8B7ADE